MATKPTFDYLIARLLMHRHSSNDIDTYVNLAINTFIHNAGIQEKGMTLDDFKLSWTYNTPTDPLTSQLLDHGIGNITPLTTHFYDVTGAGLTSQETYVLTASNGVTNPTKNATIYFRNKRHWGADADDSLTSAEILTLPSNEFATARTGVKTFDCTGGKYIWYCYPTTWGQATFWVAGLETSFEESVVSHTNAPGHTEDYYTYRSTFLQNGNDIEVTIT